MEDDILLEETTPEETELDADTGNAELEDQQDGEQEQTQQQKKVYGIVFNGTREEIDSDDEIVVPLLQKGRNYDHVHEDLEKTRKTSAETKAAMDRLTAALNQYGYVGSAQDIADALEAQARDIEPEQVRREREAMEAQEIAKQEAEAAKMEADNIRREAIFARDLAEIQKINPNVKSLAELGDKFMKLRAAGLDNLEAYEMVSHKQVTKPVAAGKEHLITTGGSKGTAPLR